MDSELDRLKPLPQSRHQDTLRKVGLLSLIGLGLLGVVIFSPNANPYSGAFFQGALETTWRQGLDFPAAWSSVKIMVFSVGLFLLIESAGTVLAVLKFRTIAIPVFFLQVIPFIGILCGAYCLLKSLL